MAIPRGLPLHKVVLLVLEGNLELERNCFRKDRQSDLDRARRGMESAILLLNMAEFPPDVLSEVRAEIARLKREYRWAKQENPYLTGEEWEGSKEGWQLS